jgi:hypothetical protein
MKRFSFLSLNEPSLSLQSTHPPLRTCHIRNGGRATVLRVAFTLPGKAVVTVVTILGSRWHRSNQRCWTTTVLWTNLLQTGIETTMPWIRVSRRRREVMLPLQPYSLLGPCATGLFVYYSGHIVEFTLFDYGH